MRGIRIVLPFGRTRKVDGNSVQAMEGYVRHETAAYVAHQGVLTQRSIRPADSARLTSESGLAATLDANRKRATRPFWEGLE
jgi:hypothetical protein